MAALSPGVCGARLLSVSFATGIHMMFSRLEHDCPTIEEIGARFRAVADFYSVFFDAIGNGRAGAGPNDVLAKLLQSEEITKAVPKLLPLNLSAASDCTN